MIRALVLLAAFIFFRTFLIHRRQRGETSPYMNSLDGLLSAEELSSAMETVAPYTGTIHRR